MSPVHWDDSTSLHLSTELLMQIIFNSIVNSNRTQEGVPSDHLFVHVPTLSGKCPSVAVCLFRIVNGHHSRHPPSQASSALFAVLLILFVESSSTESCTRRNDSPIIFILIRQEKPHCSLYRGKLIFLGITTQVRRSGISMVY